jgi:D-alanyl-D-alanine carboxypeptidase
MAAPSQDLAESGHDTCKRDWLVGRKISMQIRRRGGGIILRRITILGASLLLAACATQIDPTDQLIRSEMSDRHIPGLTFAVVKDGSVVDLRSYGLASIELNVPASSQTVYAIGSITKSFTAIVTLKLVEDGLVDLEESILVYAPSSPETWRPVTIRHLLSNTSGIPDITDSPCGVTPSEKYSMEDAVAEAACLPLLFEPGDQFSYSNTNFVLLSILIESVTGKPLADAFTDMVFSPLGMNRTQLANYRLIVPNRADGYAWVANNYVNVEDMDPAVEAGAGAVISTAEDMSKFLLSLRDESLLRSASWDLLWTPYPVRHGKTPYALGFGISPYDGHARIGHNGAAPGFASSFAWFPAEKVGVVLLSNGYEEVQGRSLMALANQVAALYFD